MGLNTVKISWILAVRDDASLTFSMVGRFNQMPMLEVCLQLARLNSPFLFTSHIQSVVRSVLPLKI